MTDNDVDQPGWYEIRIKGRLNQRLSNLFDGMTLVAGPDGVTVIQGEVVDQAALHGHLTRLRDLGLPLLAVRRAATPADEEEPS